MFSYREKRRRFIKQKTISSKYRGGSRNVEGGVKKEKRKSRVCESPLSGSQATARGISSEREIAKQKGKRGDVTREGNTRGGRQRWGGGGGVGGGGGGGGEKNISKH